MGLPCFAERRVRAVVEEAALADLSEGLDVGEVLVVADRLAGQGDVHRVVPVVRPLCGQAVAAGLAREDQLRVVHVALGDGGERDAAVRRQGVGAFGDLLQHVRIAMVEQSVHGIEAQAVDVVIAHPHQCVLDDVRADSVFIEIDRVAPGVTAAFAQVLAELGQVVARGTEVVVDDVLDDGESGRVGRIDETLVRLGSAVGLVHGVPEHPVVAPVPRTVEAVHRQQLDVGHPQVDEVVETADRGIQCSLGGEGSEVQLVDQAARELLARPRGVVPGVQRGVEPRRRLVHAAGLTPRARVGAEVVAVTEDEAVPLAVGEVDRGRPPAVFRGCHLDVFDDTVAAVVEPAQPHPLCLGCPDVDAHEGCSFA